MMARPRCLLRLSADSTARREQLRERHLPMAAAHFRRMHTPSWRRSGPAKSVELLPDRQAQSIRLEETTMSAHDYLQHRDERDSPQVNHPVE